MMTTRLIADFDNTLNDALNGVVEAEAALGRMYRAALARVAELEAQLDAQGWRPVTEEPVADGEYLTWNDFTTGFTVRRYRDGQFHSAFRNQPTHWRSLPPAPQETTR